MKQKTYERTLEIKEKMRQATLRYNRKIEFSGKLHPMQGRRHSPETKQKLKEAMERRLQKLKDEGKPHPLKGRIVPADQRLKMSIAKKRFFTGPKHPQWKGGRKKDKTTGYIRIHSPYHPYCAPNNYVLEHRLIIEKHLKRFLKPHEIAHHINRIPDDNRLENLMVFINHSVHSSLHKSNRQPKPEEIIFNGHNFSRSI